MVEFACLSGIFHQLAVQNAGGIRQLPSTMIEKQENFRIGMDPALILARPRWSGLLRECKRGFQMFTIASARETATIVAGAFLSALLLVSAATSLPIA